MNSIENFKIRLNNAEEENHIDLENTRPFRNCQSEDKEKIRKRIRNRPR